MIPAGKRGDNKACFWVSGGNKDGKALLTDCYQINLDDPANPIKLDDLPNGTSHHNMFMCPAGNVYVAGGIVKKNSKDKDKEYPFGTPTNDIYCMKNGETKWAKVADMSVPRADFEVVLAGTRAYFFCGSSGNGKGPTTAIDIFETATNKTSRANFRLPLGVKGASLAWHGKEVILIGGERCGNNSPGVMMVDFEQKSILSISDLLAPRTNSIVISVEHDQVIAIGGGG